jgi:hypothetical protein
MARRGGGKRAQKTKINRFASAFTGVCPHCRDFYAHHMGDAADHVPTCKSHLFCKDFCEEGRALFLNELAEKIVKRLRAGDRFDAKALALALLK